MKKLLSALQRINQSGFSLAEKAEIEKYIKELNQKCFRNTNRKSDVLQKTTVLPIKAHPKNFLVNEENNIGIWESVIDHEIKKGNPMPSIESSIWKDFENLLISGFAEDCKFAIYRMLKNLTNQEILDEAKRLKMSEVYTLYEAMLIMVALILANEVDEKNTSVIIYFKVNERDSLFRLMAFRNNQKLLIGYRQVDLSRASDTGSGVCFKNDFFKL